MNLKGFLFISVNAVICMYVSTPITFYLYSPNCIPQVAKSKRHSKTPRAFCCCIVIKVIVLYSFYIMQSIMFLLNSCIFNILCYCWNTFTLVYYTIQSNKSWCTFNKNYIFTLYIKSHCAIQNVLKKEHSKYWFCKQKSLL